MKKDYTVLLIQLDGNLVSDVSTKCSEVVETSEAKFHQVESREPCNLSSVLLLYIYSLGQTIMNYLFLIHLG